MNKALLILCYTADTPHRTGSQETVRWLGSGFTYYEKRIDYVRAEQQKKA